MPELDAAPEFELTIRIMGGQAITITAPGDMRLDEMVEEFIKAVNLPGRDRDGSPTVWRLGNCLSGHTCNLTKTVADLCSAQGKAELFLTRSVTAG